MLQKYRRIEARLLECRRLESYGLLASGVAHNINSPLAAIILTAEVAQAKHPRMAEFKDILQAAARIEAIVGNLADKCSEEQSREASDIDLNRLVQNELEFLQSNLFFKHQVECRQQLQSGLPSLRGHYSDLSLAFFAIVQNALDAMIASKPRKLTVGTVFQRRARLLILSVRDTGCGVAQEDLKKIFRPFFTGKAGQKLSEDQYRLAPLGLGLPLVKELLRKYGARIEVRSAVGKGSEFRLLFPVRSQS